VSDTNATETPEAKDQDGLAALSNQEIARRIAALRAEQERRKPVKKVPPEWAGIHDTKHTTLCLAATIMGWDHAGYDLEPITEGEYLEAIDRAVHLRAEYTQRYSAEGKTIRVLTPTEDFMHAVIVAVPGKLEFRADMNRLQAQAEAGNNHGFREELSKLFASRMVWPTQGSPEAIRLMDELIGLWDQNYPKAFRAAIGMDQGAIRRAG